MSATAALPQPAENPRRFTRAEFHRMAEAGIFRDEERLELVDGEIVPKSPKGPRHQSALRRIARQLRRLFSEEHWTIMEDSALGLANHRERYPDLLVARGGEPEYEDRIAEAGDVVLVVEVSDTTLTTDRGAKGPEYAAAGIPEYWIVNLPERCLEVYREPDNSEYGTRTVLYPSDEFPVESASGTLISVADLLPLH